MYCCFLVTCIPRAALCYLLQARSAVNILCFCPADTGVALTGPHVTDESKKFNLISPGVTYRCGIILMIGIAYDDIKYALNYRYLRWKGHLGGYDSISQAMSMLSRQDGFIRHIFDNAIFLKPYNKVHVRFLNQIAGPTLAEWRWRPNLASRGGRMYRQMSLGPDRWSKSWVNPVFWPDAVVGKCISTVNINIVSYPYHVDALS